MKKTFLLAAFSVMMLISFSQGSNPVSVHTIKNCIDKYSLDGFKTLKGDSLYGNPGYWCRYKCSFQLGSDSSFVFYQKAYSTFNLEFYYSIDSKAENSNKDVINEVVKYYVKNEKWKSEEDEEDEYNGLTLKDDKGRLRLKFHRNSKNHFSVLEIFSIQ